MGKCKGITKKGERCRRYAMIGTDYCYSHRPAVKTKPKKAKLVKTPAKPKKNVLTIPFLQGKKVKKGMEQPVDVIGWYRDVEKTVLTVKHIDDFTGKQAGHAGSNYKPYVYTYQRTTEYKMIKGSDYLRLELFSSFSNSYKTEHVHFDFIKNGAHNKIPKTQNKNVTEILNQFGSASLDKVWRARAGYYVLEDFDNGMKKYR